MPRYYFNLYKDGKPVLDDEGLDLQNDAVAERQAMESLRELIVDSLDVDLQPIHITLEVVKEGVGPVNRVTGRVILHEQVCAKVEALCRPRPRDDSSFVK